MAEKVIDLGSGLELWKAHPDDIREQDVNARSMPKQMFERLSQTIKRDTRLESLPLCAKTDKGIEVISGHHRTRASRAAGLTEIYIIVDTTGLSPDQIKAKQLAHNSIGGVDDAQLLVKIYKDIQDVDAKLEAYIDPAKLNITVDKVSVGNVDLGLTFRTAMICFLPYDLDLFERAADAIQKTLPADVHAVYLAELKMLETWKAVAKRTGKEYDARSMSTILARMAEIVLQSLGEEMPDDGEELIPLRDVFGVSVLPKEVAETVKTAIAKLKKSESITAKHDALKLWAVQEINSHA